MNPLFKSFSLLFILFSGSILSAHAQSKKAIDHSVYNDWKEIKNQSISNDGKYAAFEINPQKGDGVLHLYSIIEKTDMEIPRGSKCAISPNANFMVYRIKPQFDSVRAEKLKKVKKEKLPKDTVGIYVFNTKNEYRYPKLKDFRLAEKSSDWIAFRLEQDKKEEQKKDTTEVEDSSVKEKKEKKDKKDKAHLLVIFNPITGDSVTFEDVTKYALSKNGLTCAFVQVKKDSIDSVFVSAFDTRKMEMVSLFADEGYSENISVDEQGRQIAFTYSTDTVKNKAFDLIYSDVKSKKYLSVLSADFNGLEKDRFVSRYGKIFFNEKGDELYFGTAARPYNKPEDTLTEDEQVSLDIWNWKDPYLQTHQLKQLEKEKKRSFQAVFFPKDGKANQLGSESLEDVKIDPKVSGKWSLGFTNEKYRQMLSWDGSRYKDAFLINRESGDNKGILKKVASVVSLSPQQNYVAWYNITDSSWNVYDAKTGESNNVAAGLGINFYNELNDVPNEASPYGMAGWTADEKLIVYDRFDLWMIDPKLKEEAINLTNGEGRKTKTRLRYLKLDKEEQVLPEVMLLSAFNEVGKQAGYYTLELKKSDLEKRLYGDFYFGKTLKAKESESLIWTKESFVDFPDLYSSSLTFSNPVKITDANPQQKDYNWGTTELVEWVTFNGDSLQGILVKPEDFDPGKTYPMLVYFYERSTPRLNRYYMPKPIRSTVNWTYYASNGYLIFIPDIIYKTGYPGPSAYDCIVSGTMAMCERFDFIDRNLLGIQGQSWGGYQTAYIVTQTNLYKAAMAGAPVSNMTSAYGGIRWGTGLSRAFQYEETQSRIGATLWESRDLYILNSPLFFVDRIETPLLMMHNDEDGAVPWYQGIEMFSAMRRLNKPVWMLVYNKAPHNLKRWADMEDLTVRMQQFFDFYLKDAREPAWMKYGVPAIDKGRKFGFETE